jgi:hypothetical protein
MKKMIGILDTCNINTQTTNKWLPFNVKEGGTKVGARSMGVVDDFADDDDDLLRILFLVLFLLLLLLLLLLWLVRAEFTNGAVFFFFFLFFFEPFFWGEDGGGEGVLPRTWGAFRIRGCNFPPPPRLLNISASVVIGTVKSITESESSW